MSRTFRWLLKTARTIHVYLTLFGLTLILFFAITGFILNHPELFAPSKERLKQLQRTETRKLPLDKMPGGKLPEAPADGSGEPPPGDQLPVIEALRKEFNIRGEKTGFVFKRVQWATDPNADPDDPNVETVEKKVVEVVFTRPGSSAKATTDLETAETRVVWDYEGWAAVMGDLHRGNRGGTGDKPTVVGAVWPFVIDATCVILLIISATGLVMWWSLKTRGKWGAILFVLGTVMSFAVYYWFVP